MKILIIGGSGYIGTKLYKELVEYGMDVTSVDLEWFSPSVHSNINMDAKNISEEYLQMFNVVIYLSGHSSVKMGEDGLSSIHNNLINFTHLLDKLHNTSIKLIYASTSSIYGRSGSVERDEDYSNFIPGNFYDLTKMHMETYASMYNVEAYGLRFGTVNGWSPHLRTDIMLNAMYNSANINGIIHASNINVNRAILDISDLCNAIKKIITNRNDCRGVYNLASFNGTVEYIAQCAANILKCFINFDYRPSSNLVHDFAITSNKFTTNFDFKFTGSINTILESLSRESVYKTHRNNSIEYRI